jgi:hypothetical protein
VEYINYFPVDADGNGYLWKWESVYDVAILGLDDRLGSRTGVMNIDPYGYGGTYHVTGYPMVFVDSTGARMIDDTGTASLDRYYNLFNFSSSLEVHPGNSGGPLWHTVQGVPSVAGIVSTGSWGPDLYGTYGTLRSWIAGNDFLLAGRVAAPVGMESADDPAVPGTSDDFAVATGGDAWTLPLDLLLDDDTHVGLVGVSETMPMFFSIG